MRSQPIYTHHNLGRYMCLKLNYFYVPVHNFMLDSYIQHGTLKGILTFNAIEGC
jgi:hypothetical protein